MRDKVQLKLQGRRDKALLLTSRRRFRQTEEQTSRNQSNRHRRKVSSIQTQPILKLQRQLSNEQCLNLSKERDRIRGSFSDSLSFRFRDRLSEFRLSLSVGLELLYHRGLFCAHPLVHFRSEVSFCE